MHKDEFRGSKILLVEDEDTLAIGLEYNLTEEGFQVTWVNDGKKALESIQKEKFDLIILDIMLPYLDGFEVAKKVRKDYPRMPILMLTARTGVKDRIYGLEIGADDYLTKPFHLKELMLRVQGMLRRSTWYESVTDKAPVFRFGSNEVNFNTLKCNAGDKEIQLTMHEAMLLKYLIDNSGKAISRKELLEKVWQINPDIETRTVDNFIARLRKYFELEPEIPTFIKSVRGVGYMFVESD